MPRGKKPGANVAHIFEQFVGSLSALIKEKVSESVNIATTEFFNSKIGAGAAKIAERKTVKRRGRKPGRPKGKPGRPKGKPGRKPGRPKGKPGRPPKALTAAAPKRRGRPPKIHVEPVAEEKKTE